MYARTAHLCESNSSTNRHGVRRYVILWYETATRLPERVREAGTTFRGGVRARSLLRSASSAVIGVEVGEYGPGGAAPRGETMRHEALLVIVADGAGDFAGDEGTKKLRATALRGGSTARGLTAPRRTTCTFYSPTLERHRGRIRLLPRRRQGGGGGSVWTRAVADRPETLGEGFDRMMGEASLDGWLRGA